MPGDLGFCDLTEPLDWPHLRVVLPNSLAWLEPMYAESKGRLDRPRHRNLVGSYDSMQEFSQPYVQFLVQVKYHAWIREPCLSIVWFLCTLYGWLDDNLWNDLLGTEGQRGLLYTMNWSRTLGSGWPVFTYLETILQIRLGFDFSSIRASTVNAANSELIAASFRSADETVRVAATRFVDSTLNRALQAKDSKTEIADAVHTLAAVERLMMPEEPLYCWSNKSYSSRINCCGVNTDHCCSATAHLPPEANTPCWSNGRTHERCCKEFASDECMQYFNEVLDKDLMCKDYAIRHGIQFAYCVAWTMPDRDFAEGFAVPFLESGRGRCFEIELSLDDDIGLKNPFAGAQALTNQRCLSGGCPWAYFGVCTPHSCTTDHLKVGWRIFLNIDTDMCPWENVRVREYTSAEQLRRTWLRPVKVMHYSKCAGHAVKRRMFHWHTMEPRSGWGDEETGTVAPVLMCQTSRHIPHCDDLSETSYAFFVREPAQRTISDFTCEFRSGIIHGSEEVFQRFPNPTLMAEALYEPAAVADAWRGWRMFTRESFTSNLGGPLHIQKCLAKRRIQFVGRTEHVEEDVVKLHRSAGSGIGLEHALDVDVKLDNVNAKFKQMKTIPRHAFNAVRAFMAEDYFIVAQLLWRGLLPASYLDWLQLRGQAASNMLANGSESSCDMDDAGATAWMSRLLNIQAEAPKAEDSTLKEAAEVWWLCWREDGELKLFGVLSEAVGLAFLADVFAPGNHEAVLISPGGLALGTSRGDLEALDPRPFSAYIRNVARVLCQEELLSLSTAAEGTS
eukprot:TRINITY_DN20968_c0_g1_i5.p1 TRINITY_DN20968_c0_g1~~TRINITY_DN20968_c0_g1_i5.p1  ORF type:complete len:788 (+),score=138.10 TRINITY_DN20968_c0_g1_i5:60-2423(+)